MVLSFVLLFDAHNFKTNKERKMEEELKNKVEELECRIGQLRRSLDSHKEKADEVERQSTLYLDAFVDSNTPIESLSPLQKKRCLMFMVEARKHQRLVKQHENLISSLCCELYSMNENYTFIKWGIRKPNQPRPSTDSSLFGRHH